MQVSVVGVYVKLIYLFIAYTKSIVWTHTLCNAGWENRQYRTVVQDIEDGRIVFTESREKA